jgi:nidogen (entactin)
MKRESVGTPYNNIIMILLFTETCDTANDCSPYGICTFSNASDHHVCICLPGYTGDGYNCYVTSQYNETDDEESPDPSCLLGVCWCPSGYELQDDTCVWKEKVTEEMTDGDTECNDSIYSI